MSEPLISIIVPIYKVEPYLDRCVSSLVNQTYSNLEIILVDDGSPDQCPEICDLWAKKDPRIHVFHKMNGGLSDARNYGTSHAEGEYITFVDSDDCIANNYVEYLYDLLKKENAEIACCNFEKFSSSMDFHNIKNSKIDILSGEEACLQMFENVQLVIACGKLLPKRLVEQSLFPVGRLHEDEATVYKILYAADRIAVSNLKLYGYYQNANGIMHTYSEKNDADLLSTYKERMEFYADHEAWRLYSESFHAYVCQLFRSIKKPERNIVRALLRQHMFDKKVLLKTKLKMEYYIVFGKLPSWMK